ncbi:MAG: hypothetical protein ACRC7S_12250, partial [Cetobacterium sp.]
MASTNYIYVDLKTNVENCKLQEKILQGSTNRTFAFTLFDRGKQSLLDSTAEISIITLYDPKIVDGKLSTKGSFVLDKNNANYDITIVEEMLGGQKFSIIHSPFHEEFVTFAGNCELIVRIVENGIETYTYSMMYVVDRNDGYFPQSIPDNLPNYKGILKSIEDLKNSKAEKDLSNVSDSDFKAKINKSGVGNIETASQIKTA